MPVLLVFPHQRGALRRPLSSSPQLPSCPAPKFWKGLETGRPSEPKPWEPALPPPSTPSLPGPRALPSEVAEGGQAAPGALTRRGSCTGGLGGPSPGSSGKPVPWVSSPSVSPTPSPSPVARAHPSRRVGRDHSWPLPVLPLPHGVLHTSASFLGACIPALRDPPRPIPSWGSAATSPGAKEATAVT